MNTTFKALLLIPLALLASCATGPKLTPEMEALRQSLNQRMARTTSIIHDASSIKTESGAVYNIMNKNVQNFKTTIQPNCDVIIEFSDTQSSGPNKASLKYISTRFVTLKLKSNQLGRANPWMSDLFVKQHGKLFYSNSEYATAQSGRYYECMLSASEDFIVLKDQQVPFKSTSYTNLGQETIATSLDKSFIQGIDRDFKRFIELYKALPK